MALSFNGHTVVVTGAAGGLGKAYVYSICDMFISITRIYSYSLLFASRGANVVVNDFNATAAQKVVDEIVKGLAIVHFSGASLNPDFLAGGKAVVNTSSVSDGAAVIKTAIDTFGTVTILINNAGILRDKGWATPNDPLFTVHFSSSSFKNMSDKEWDQIVEVHLKGAFSCTKAAWPLFRKQKFGRVINTSSAAGLYGV